MNPRVRSIAEVGAASVLLILVILWMAGVFGHKIEPHVESNVGATVAAGAQTATVREASVPVVEEAAGTVQAERKTVVSARIVATIREVHVRGGDEVKSGATLITLDARDLSAQLEQAQRAVDAAQAARDKADSDLRRARPLVERKVISPSEFEQTQSAFAMADAELERARQARQAADVALTYATITAPVSGRIVDRFADPGDTVMPGKPLLSLYDPSALRIEVPVREGLVSRLATGASVQVRLGSGDDVVAGTIDEIVPQAEAGSRTFLVKVGLPRGGNLYTGMFGRVLIPVGERQRLLIPAAAVQRVGQLELVDVVGADRKRERRLVTLGQAVGQGEVEVLSGLRAGELVLVAAR